MGIKAGEAFVEIIADNKKLDSGLDRAQLRLKAFGAAVRKIGFQLTGLGAALSLPFALGAKEFVKFETSLQRINVLLSKNTKNNWCF